ncbi:MAG: zf-HC2 domain-containing protein [Desulfobacteraceae bacterium]|nr:zf-HC2 domain-containing protein [Desulfobacteraceae bacterium]
MKNPCKISAHLIRFYPAMPKKLMQHIQSCADCTEKLKSIELFAKLQPDKQNYAALEKATSCPDDNQFAAFLDSELPEEQRQKMENHLLNCPYCFHIAAEYIKEHHPETATIEQLLAETEPSKETVDLFEKVRGLSESFINKYYPAMQEWFDDAFGAIKESILAGEQLAVVPIRGMGFAQNKQQTIAKTVLIMQKVLKEAQPDWTHAQYKKCIEKQCKKFKADKKLKNALIKHITPKLNK